MRNIVMRWLQGAALVIALAVASLAVAEEAVSNSFWSGVAIGGHDATAYRALPAGSAAREGAEGFVHEWKGAEWRFADAASRDVFAADPEAYAPAYNGFCANALSIGEGLVKTDGTVWQLFGDQLYLFYANGGRERWLDGDWQAFKAKADAAWAELKDS